MTIDTLGRGCGFAATYPAPFEGEHDEASRTRAIRALGSHWGKLGFEHFSNGVWVLDLTARTFEDRTAWLIKHLDI